MPVGLPKLSVSEMQERMYGYVEWRWGGAKLYFFILGVEVSGPNLHNSGSRVKSRMRKAESTNGKLDQSMHGMEERQRNKTDG